MRVLIIHQNFVDHQHPGGTRHLDVGLRLVEQGHDVTIVASDVDYLTGKPIRKQGPEVYDGVKVVRAHALPSVQRGLIWRAVSYLSFVPTSMIRGVQVGPVDVVLGTTPHIFQLPSTWFVARWRRAPFVLEVLDLWPEFAVGMGVLKNRLLIRMAKAASWLFYRAAQHLVVNSPAYKDYLVEGGIRPEQITFIPMGVDIDLFHPESDGRAVRDQHGLGNKFVVTYAGSISLANDLDTVLNAADRLRDDPEVHILLAGGGNQKPRLEAKAASMGLCNVTFGGTFPKQRVGDVLAASDACLATLRDIPEFRTPFPNKVFDYMAAGRPVLLAIDGVIREVVERAGGGVFVPPGNPDALADAIRQLKTDRDEARRMGRAGRAFVEQHYQIGLQADRFAEVFRNVTQAAR